MATVLIVDDDQALREGLSETISDLGHQPVSASSGREALARVSGDDIDAVLLDLRMPGDVNGIEFLRRIRKQKNCPPVVVLTAFASSENTIEAMRLGAFDHLTKPIGRDELASLLARMISDRETVPTIFSQAGASREALVGSSEAMRRVQKMIGLAADSDTTVLILGETGTGKELVARALHEHGRRKDKPFVAVNCAAIPAELLESELFGHVKGAFTGATFDRPGAFRAADGGTILLDEIGDMSGVMQAKILRALQEKIVTPLGGRPVEVDVRVLAATHHDLPSLVSANRFREDLFYRLNVVSIRLPPLRERSEDIVQLAEHFLQLSAGQNAPRRLSAAAAARLRDHRWPGNIRELKNLIERAHVLVRGEVIEDRDLDIGPEQGKGGALARERLNADLPGAVAQLEKEMIVRALEQSRGNRAEAARQLKINRQLLYNKMQRYGISTEASENATPPVRKIDGRS
jgi:two-component system NtrC family response regulator